MSYFSLLLALISCSDKPLPEPNMQQGLQFAKANPGEIAYHIDLENNNLYFLSVNLPPTAQHKGGMVRLHNKGYKKISNIM